MGNLSLLLSLFFSTFDHDIIVPRLTFIPFFSLFLAFFLLLLVTQ